MNDSLREAYGNVVRAEGPDDGPEVDMDRILDAVQGVSGPEEVSAVVLLTIEHLSWARAWSEARAMVALQASEPPNNVAHFVVPQAANRRWPWAAGAVAVAAAALLAVAVTRQPASSPYRDGPAQGFDVRSPESVLRGDATLAWDAAADVHVQVQVFDQALSPIASASGMGLDRFTVPLAALASVPSQGTLIWSLKITHADGRITTSPSFRTRLQD